ncbi:hypothetical protein CCHR01_04528 [Colletotrichum chrysophilum]|uniref:Uncharacterized protein n=1 Tax=Colletotrichum chrysophilum TaxID=1836956 RepID=A0AAD9AT94_9PEZI|nr:hypothetical protein CCHR01_04528 [Colletotrichum chrysophilum]
MSNPLGRPAKTSAALSVVNARTFSITSNTIFTHRNRFGNALYSTPGEDVDLL